MSSISKSARSTHGRSWVWSKRLLAVLGVTIGCLIAPVVLLGLYVWASRDSVLPTWAATTLHRVLLRVPNEKLQALVPDELPKPARPHTVRWLDQGWSNAERFWFHHAPQGTALPLPYHWFVALQQPGLTFVGSSSLLRDPEYLRQFGFITSPRTLQTSAERLSDRYGYPDEEMRLRLKEALARHVAQLRKEMEPQIAAGTARIYAFHMAQGIRPDQMVPIEAELKRLAEAVADAVTLGVLERLSTEFGYNERDAFSFSDHQLREVRELEEWMARTQPVELDELRAGFRSGIESHVHKIVSELYGDLATRQKGTAKISPNLQRRFPENIDGLPVGFARTPGFVHPATGEHLPDQLGFTCAVCHTSELTYKGTSIRIDGGAANINLLAFGKAFVQAMVYTQIVPGRFDAFAARVLGVDHTPEEKAKLKADFDATVKSIRRAKELQDLIVAERVETRRNTHGAKAAELEQHVVEGFGRLDALNRIGNQVFFTDLLTAGKPDEMSTADWLAKQLSFQNQTAKQNEVNPNTAELRFRLKSNFARHSAPVSFPPIWNTSWHIWAQYDASIMQPVIRNLGEALGVGAKVNLVQSTWRPIAGVSKVSAAQAKAFRPLFRSSVDLQDLHDIEIQLAGCRDAFPVDLVAPAAPPPSDQTSYSIRGGTGEIYRPTPAPGQSSVGDPCAKPDAGAAGFKGLQAPRWLDVQNIFELRTARDRQEEAKVEAAAAWRLDWEKVHEGRKLYIQICAECHLPPVRDPGYREEIRWQNHNARPAATLYDLWDPATIFRSNDPADPSRHNYRQGIPNRIPAVPQPPDPEGLRTPPPTYWLEIETELGKKRYIDVVQKSAKEMGTDIEAARVLDGRRVRLPRYLNVNPQVDMKQWGCRQSLPGSSSELSYGLALMAVVDKVAQQWLLDKGKYGGWGEDSHKELQRFIGHRPSCPNPLTVPEANAEGKAEPQYRARSLDGIWATAPYLHNGSVPNLWALLSPDPRKDRPETFCVGSKEFDPKLVGLSTTCERGTFKFDTTIPGNSRFGHEFRGARPKQVPEQGVVGRELSERERWAIIEYLKTL